MPDATAFNLEDGLKAERKLMITYANTGTEAAPVWEALGVGVEDSAIEFNFDEATVTDILGTTSTTIAKPQRKQSLDPFTIRDGSPLQVKLYNIIRNERWAELANMDMLIVHYYVGSPATGFDAERFTGSAINPQSLGGSANLDMPIEVTYGGTHTIGTATNSGGAITFTPEE